jgi:hypothetical protein
MWEVGLGVWGSAVLAFVDWSTSNGGSFLCLSEQVGGLCEHKIMFTVSKNQIQKTKKLFIKLQKYCFRI